MLAHIKKNNTYDCLEQNFRHWGNVENIINVGNKNLLTDEEILRQ